MAAKSLDAALRAPRKGIEDPEREERRLDEELVAGEGIERELAQLIAQFGPDPDRIVELLAGRPEWERRRAELKLVGHYGHEVAGVLRRAAENFGVHDSQNPAIQRLRKAAKAGPGGHAQLVAEAARRRAAGERAELPEGLREEGHALPADVAAEIERVTGQRLGDVRVITGPVAQAATRAVGARALTTDGMILVRDEEYAPDTAEGRAVLAHEAVHALQQRGSDGAAGLAGAAAEHEAHSVAAAVAYGAPQGIGHMPVTQALGTQQVARLAESDSDAKPGGKSTKSIDFKLGGASIKVDLDVPNQDKANQAQASANAQVDLPTEKLNSLLPKGVKFTESTVKIRLTTAGKLESGFAIKGNYEGREPYIKPVPFSFTCDTAGTLKAELSLELNIPNFCTAKADKVTIDKKGVTTDIKVTSAQFKLPNGLTVEGGATFKLEDNELKSVDSSAELVLPQKLGKAKISAKINGGKLSECEADLAKVQIPGFTTITGKLKWDEAKGFTTPGLDVDVNKIPGLKGSVKLKFDGKLFTADGEKLKFTSKALSKVKIDKIVVGEGKFSATISIKDADVEVPGWIKLSKIAGSATLDGADLSLKGVTATVAVADNKATGTATLSLTEGEVKAKVDINTLNLAPNVLSLTKPPLTFDVDLGGKGGDKIAVTGGITVKLGTLGHGDVTSLELDNGHFTGKSHIDITSGLLKGLAVDVELLNSAPYVKGEVKKADGFKLNLPKAGTIPIDAEITNVDIKLDGELHLNGTISGKFKVDGGKLAEGTVKIDVKEGKIKGSASADVKSFPFVKGSGSLKVDFDGETIKPSGEATFKIEKWVKGDIKVKYDQTHGVTVDGKGLVLDIPGLPFDTSKPFDVKYANSEFEVEDLQLKLLPGKVPGVASATGHLNFKGGKLSIEVKDVTFTIPQLKQTSLHAKWDDGKWDVGGEGTITLPKGLSCKFSFNAGGGKEGGGVAAAGQNLHFDAEIEVDLNEVKKIIPHVEITSGSLKISYKEGKLHFDNASVGIAFFKDVLAGTVEFSMNDDHSFNAKGDLALQIKFVKAKNIHFELDHNTLKEVSVTGLELDLPVGKGTLTGNAAFKSGSFSCDLQAKVTDIPWVQELGAHVVIDNGDWKTFDAHGKFKPTPGIDLSKLNIGGKLDGGSPAFYCDGDIPIKGLEKPLNFHFLVGAGKFEMKASGSGKIPGLGEADVEIEMGTDVMGGKVTFHPDGKIVEKASGWVKYDGALSFGGSVTLKLGDYFSGEVGFEKKADGDWMLNGTFTPVKATFGMGGKKSLLGGGKGFGLDIPIPILTVGVADVHAGLGLEANFDAGILMPELKILPIEISCNLSKLASGELPDVKFQVELSTGVYASFTLNAKVFIGLMLLGASVDLEGTAGVTIQPQALLKATVGLQKQGNAYSVEGGLTGELDTVLKIGVGLDLAAKFLGHELFKWPIASKDWDLGNLAMGKADLGHFKYTLGNDSSLPAGDNIGVKKPELGPVGDKGKTKVADAAQPYLDQAKGAIDEAKKVIEAPYEAGKWAVNKVEDGASAAWDAVSSW